MFFFNTCRSCLTVAWLYSFYINSAADLNWYYLFII